MDNEEIQAILEAQKNRKRISNLKNKLYYIKNKETINQKRKEYKRQSWENRKDNPKRIRT
jgi:hypothetical protein